MACGYYIVELDVRKPEMMGRYRELVGPTLEKFGAEILAASNEVTHLQGEPAPLPRVVVIRFPTYQGAIDWFRSDDYAEALAIREAACINRAYVVEGKE
jgi:uncharacterized protein (DUF1330 family)